MKLQQVSVFLENKKGRLAEVTSLIADKGINIRALSLADTADFGVLRLIVNDPDRCFEVLKAAGYVAQRTDVIAVEVDDRWRFGSCWTVMNFRVTTPRSSWVLR